MFKNRTEKHLVKVELHIGALQRKKFKKSEFSMEMGGWVQVSLGIFLGKSSQNSSKQVMIFWSSIQCVLCLYIHC